MDQQPEVTANGLYWWRCREVENRTACQVMRRGGEAGDGSEVGQLVSENEIIFNRS